MTTSDISRLFSAVVWSETARVPLDELQRTLQEIHPSPALRWIEPVDLHLTLRFYGNVSQGQCAQLAHTLDALATQALATELTFVRFEPWPEARPRMIVAVFRAARGLLSLQSAIEADARQRGFEPETRRFQAHVTLARAAGRWDGALAKIKLAPFALPARELGLWYRGDGPIRYREWARYAFAPVP